MSKLTNEDKANLISEACAMFKEANDIIIKAKKLLKRCNIESCNGFNEDTFMHSYHILLHSGIKKMEKLLNISAYHPKNWCDKIDRGCLCIEHNGIMFHQLGEERTSTQANFKFR